MAESLDPTKPRSCILGFLEALSAVANALILSSALYLSKISRMFKTAQIYVKDLESVWEQGLLEQGMFIGLRIYRAMNKDLKSKDYFGLYSLIPCFLFPDILYFPKSLIPKSLLPQ